MVIRRIRESNWYTKEGVALKRAAIHAKGVPDMTNWRFITLTLDPSKFETPDAGYLAGKDRMRRFLAGIKELLGVDNVPWCWKLEFQENGWAHWHLCFSYTKKLTRAEWESMKLIWGLGRIDVKRIEYGSLSYLFKYVTKDSFKGDSDTGIMLPTWFLDHIVQDKTGKHVTFSKVRFWQTSQGFYTGTPPDPPEKKEPHTCLLPPTVRERVRDRARTVRIMAQDKFQDVVKSATITLREAWKGGIEPKLAQMCVRGQAAPLGMQAYISSHTHIQKLCLKHQKHLVNRVQVHQRVNPQSQVNAYLRTWGVAIPY